MKTSAKVTAISLLAAWSLGVAIFSACTVNSTTTNDTDGGVGTNPTTNPTDSTGGTSGGTSGAPAASCAGDTDAGGPIRSAACQACLDSKCCTQVTGCMAINVGATGISCADYGDCLDKCADNDENCFQACDTATADSGVVQAYESITTCADGPENANLQPDASPVAAADNCVQECN